MSKKLIALVATAVMLNGVRTIIQPGKQLPDMSGEDEKALLNSGMAQDPAATAALDTADAQAQAQTQRQFQEARDRVLAAQSSIAPSPTFDPAADTTVVPGATAAAAPAPAPESESESEPAPAVEPEPATPAKKAKDPAK